MYNDSDQWLQSILMTIYGMWPVHATTCSWLPTCIEKTQKSKVHVFPLPQHLPLHMLPCYNIKTLGLSLLSSCLTAPASASTPHPSCLLSLHSIIFSLALQCLPGHRRQIFFLVIHLFSVTSTSVLLFTCSFRAWCPNSVSLSSKPYRVF